MELQLHHRIETLQPGDRFALVGMASIYQRRKEFDRALEVLGEALAQTPEDPKLLQRIGEVYTDRREVSKALEFLQAAERQMHAMGVDEVDQLTHRLALAYHHGGDFATAEKMFDRVGEGGRTAAFYFDFGVTLEKLGKILAAGDAYNQALGIEPTQPEARINIAALHHQYGDVNESIPQYLVVINSPSTPASLRIMAMGNVGAAYEVSRDIVNALSWYERALEATTSSPDMVFSDRFLAESRMHLMVHVVRAKLSACVWADAEKEFDSLWAMVTNPQTTVYPPEAKHTEQLTRLNVGYISYDYSDHPTTHLMEGIFATRDRGSMNVVAFGYGRDDGSAFRQRVVESVDKFVDLSSVSFEESAERIRREHIHIVMDAQGHTRRGRMQIVAARPAPIVVNYLVYPGTSGASFVDYVIVDKYVTPPAELASAFTEKLVVMPHSYQVNYYKQVLGSSKSIHRRSDLWQTDDKEVKDDGFLFVNFNKIDKLEASVFSTWMTILRRVPRSSLLLLDPGRLILDDDATESITSRQIKKNLWREAQAQGISTRRVRFVSRTAKLEHLQRHCTGGLFLDTFIYGAHSTATDALYAGLPVLTLAGDSFASRVGVSLLENLGMQELVTFSRKEYEDLAVYLARTPSVLSQLKHWLRRDQVEFEQPLFHTKQHTNDLEASQRLMHDVYVLTKRTFHLVV
ncbi:hypothetical protein PF010_g6399 [Phytophthora fragariae]|uniref:protein O-GlcNAc transferase n=1 Tax=Phytophthora fragariae TaxID=53985 RepID=A0A6A3L823_9STRA|nr:hypothetical protein PF009_g7925 [Phytophthora fragariae]KAE9015702.1 hypothetical protein PF011_g7508 [Phytophthora fragariae]KAE9123460.1 hypothetical protein PF010_g6399 [Phytophthora fragariae]KAE9148636.1 hypothetical protein PF006_g6795 [Phytophthora fragariae]